MTRIAVTGSSGQLGEQAGHRRSPRKLVERLDVDGVEPLANAEQEDADDDEGDQDREGDADLDHQRHALGAGGGQDQAVLHRHEADDLADRVAPHHHHQQPQQHDREGERQVLARQRIDGRAGGLAASPPSTAPTRPMPASMVRPMPATVSMVR